MFRIAGALLFLLTSLSGEDDYSNEFWSSYGKFGATVMAKQSSFQNLDDTPGEGLVVDIAPSTAQIRLIINDIAASSGDKIIWKTDKYTGSFFSNRDASAIFTDPDDINLTNDLLNAIFSGKWIAFKNANSNSMAQYTLNGAREAIHAISNYNEGSKWEISKSRSEIDDTASVICVLNAENTVFDGIDEMTPRLVIRYIESKLSAYFNFDTRLTYSEEVKIPVKMRLGKDFALDRTLNLSSDNEALFFESAEVTSLFKKFENVHTLVLRFTHHRHGTITAKFQTRGVGLVKAAILESVRSDLNMYEKMGVLTN